MFLFLDPSGSWEIETLRLKMVDHAGGIVLNLQTAWCSASKLWGVHQRNHGMIQYWDIDMVGTFMTQSFVDFLVASKFSTISPEVMDWFEIHYLIQLFRLVHQNFFVLTCLTFESAIKPFQLSQAWTIRNHNLEHKNRREQCLHNEALRKAPVGDTAALLGHAHTTLGAMEAVGTVFSRTAPYMGHVCPILWESRGDGRITKPCTSVVFGKTCMYSMSIFGVFGFLLLGQVPCPVTRPVLGKIAMSPSILRYLEPWGISPSASIYSNILGAASAVSTIPTYWEYKTWDLDGFSRNMLDWDSCGGYAVMVLVDFGNGSGDEGGLGSCVGDGREDDDRWLAIMMTVNGQIGSPYTS